jgi:superfamily II DNA/RNA helicase
VPTVEQFYYEVDRRFKIELLERLIDIHDFKLGLIFCNTKRMVDDLVDHLEAAGYLADRLHGDMSQNMRDRVMNKFRKSGLEFLVATDVAARGIHVEGIAHVVNYDLPMASEDFVHRVGRTGRAGSRGVASTFGTSADRQTIRRFERELKMSLTRRPTTEALAWHKDHVPAAPLFEDPAPAFAPKQGFGKQGFGKSTNRTEPAWAKSNSGPKGAPANKGIGPNTKPRTFGGFKSKFGSRRAASTTGR